MNASANVDGTYRYSVALGTVLSAGVQSLSVTFTPTDTIDYTTATMSVEINVTPALLTVTANNATKPYGAANPNFTASYTGFVNGDTPSMLSGSPSLTTAATTASNVGSYPISVVAGTLSAANSVSVMLTERCRSPRLAP